MAGTQKFHCFQPINLTSLYVKEYSNAPEAILKRLSTTKDANGISTENLHGYVIAAFLQD